MTLRHKTRFNTSGQGFKKDPIRYQCCLYYLYDEGSRSGCPKTQKLLTPSICVHDNSMVRFYVTVKTQINKSVVYFIVRRNVKFWCSEC